MSRGEPAVALDVDRVPVKTIPLRVSGRGEEVLLGALRRDLQRAVRETENPGPGPAGRIRWDSARLRVHKLADLIEQVLSAPPT